MSPADGPASPSCTRAMPQSVAVAYTASTLGAAARCSKSTSFLPLMPLSRLVARHSRMLSRSYGGRVCGAVACVWPVLTRLLSVPCLGHNNRTRGAARGPSKPRNRQMMISNVTTRGSPRAAGPSRVVRRGAGGGRRQLGDGWSRSPWPHSVLITANELYEHGKGAPAKVHKILETRSRRRSCGHRGGGQAGGHEGVHTSRRAD